MSGQIVVRTAAFAVAAACLVSCGGGGGGGGGSGGGAVTITAPGAPTVFNSFGTDRAAFLAFHPPSSNGGAAITSYSASCTDGVTSQTISGSDTELVVRDLVNGVAYSCTVRATNSAGPGPVSAAVSVTPTNGTPGAPTIQTITGANTSAVVSFTPPAHSGSTAIKGYAASCKVGSTQVFRTGTGSPIVVLGLTNGVNYSCIVNASNATGASAVSAALSVVPNPTSATPAGVASNTTIDFGVVVSYAMSLPAYYDATVTPLDNMPAGVAPNDRIISLGRVLFYDQRLSIDDSTSCSSCHAQAIGFSTAGAIGRGVGGALTPMRPMRLSNVRYFAPGSMFWDRRAASLEQQASQALQGPTEMGWDASHGGIAALIGKMEGTTYYRDLFNFAFGAPVITEARVQQALAQFQRTLISTTSRWDQGYATTFNAMAPDRGLRNFISTFTSAENRGLQLFMTSVAEGGAGCSACHVPPTFSLAADARSNGLDAGETRVFKAPSLKNSPYGPFMHDGRFQSFSHVVEFYSSGIQAGPALDNRLRQSNGQPLRLNLSSDDKGALVSFLDTLDDRAFGADPRFASAVK